MQKMNATDKMLREMRGDAPDFASLTHVATNFGIQYVKALNWVHYNVDEAELKQELIQCLQDRKAEHLVPYVGDLDGVTFSTLGKIAYCVNRGADLAASSILRMRTALERVREGQDPQVNKSSVLDDQDQTAAGRVNEIYKACYSRLDNMKARVLQGTLKLEDVTDEVTKLLEAQGAKAQVRKRLVEHYTQSVQEAMVDKTLKTWVKPLQMILKALGGDVKIIKEKVQKVVAKETQKAIKEKAVKAKATKATKEKAAKPKKAKGETKVITIKPKQRAEGAPTVASQVRDLIRVNKRNTDEKGMVEIVIRELGLTKERGRSVVKAFWTKVEVA